MESDCGTNADWRTYGGVNETANESAYSKANESAYSKANETNGMSENPPATRRRTRSPLSPNGDYGDPRPCAAHRE